MQSERFLSLLPRIKELEQALFFNESPSVLSLPVSVINVLQIDEVGQLWFAVTRPPQQLNEFERTFPSRLELYRKGAGFHMRVLGKSFLIIDPEEIAESICLHPSLSKAASDNMLIVKMRVERIDYFPHLDQSGNEAFSTPRLLSIPVSGFFKSLQDVFKNIVPVFQSH